ncbi:MAG: methyltransferase domain-containing protein [Bdellovibrionales bacterium]|nr:methyltransferase domain-containing protein [Bdellovibrionales bacterium]
MTKSTYVHGRNSTEAARLQEQATDFAELVHGGVDWSNSDSLLEIGMGVGAQTKELLLRNPGLSVTGIEISMDNIRFARETLSALEGAEGRFKLINADARALPINIELTHPFDGAFICWALEHISNPIQVLSEIKRVLKPGSQLVLREVIENTVYIYPSFDILAGRSAIAIIWERLNQLQRQSGQDPNIGVRLPYLLMQAGFQNIECQQVPLVGHCLKQKDRENLIDLFEGLVIGATPQLVDSNDKDWTQPEVSRLADEAKLEFDALRSNPQTSITTSIMKAQASA